MAALKTFGQKLLDLVNFAGVDRPIVLPSNPTAIISDDVNHHIERSHVDLHLRLSIEEGRKVDPYIRPAVFVSDDIGTVRRVDLESGNITNTLKTGASKPITTIALGSVQALCQGGAYLCRSLFAGSADGNIYVWAFDTDDIGRFTGPASQDKTFIGHKAPIVSLECVWVTPLMIERLVSADEDGVVIVWERSGALVHKLEGVYGVRSLSTDQVRKADSQCPHPDKATVMAGCKAGVRAWRIHWDREYRWKIDHSTTINRDSAVEVSGTGDQASKLEEKIERSSSWNKDPPAEDSNSVESVTQTNTMSNTDEKEEASPTVNPFIPHENSITAIQFESFERSKRDLWVATGNQVLCLRRDSNWAVGTILQHDNPVQHLVLGEGLGVVVTSSIDKNVKVWDAKVGTLLHLFLVDDSITGITIVELDRWKGVVCCTISGKIWRWSLKFDR